MKKLGIYEGDTRRPTSNKMECRELKGKPCFQQVAYCVFFPFIFVWYSMKIYCFPCIGRYATAI